jgi:hypothetical protein
VTRNPARSLGVFLLFVLTASLPILAQSIEILPASTLPDQADPGTVTTKAFFVSNRGSVQEEYTTALTIPPGWRVIALDSNPVIPLKSGGTVFATVFVPSNANADIYNLVLSLNDRISGAKAASFSYGVTVREKPGFEIQSVSAPDYAIAGEVYQSIFRIQNTGNVLLALGITVTSRPDLDFVSEINQVALPPGRSRVFAVSVRTDQSYSERVRHTLILKVVADAEPTESKNETSSVEILPRISGEEDLFRTLPVNIAVRQALRHAETDTYGFLANVHVEGALSESGDDYFSSNLKVPFDKDGAQFNEESEIAISYKNDPFELFLGNTFFSVSTLTENSIYGTGARIEYEGESFLFGGYHTETAFSPPSVSQTAFWYGQDIGDLARVRFNLVDSINRVTPGSISTISSVEVEKTGGEGPNTVFEYASNSFNGFGDAYHLSLNDTLPGFSYALETFKADTRFRGELKDMEVYSGQVHIPLNPSLAVTSNLKSKYSSLSQRVPALAESRSVGLRWKINSENGVGVSYSQIDSTNPERIESLSRACPKTGDF